MKQSTPTVSLCHFKLYFLQCVGRLSRQWKVEIRENFSRKVGSYCETKLCNKWDEHIISW